MHFRTGDICSSVEVESLPLAPDVYVLDIGCRSGDFHSLVHIPAGVEIEIITGPNTPGTIVRKGAGVRSPQRRWDPNLSRQTARRERRSGENLHVRRAVEKFADMERAAAASPQQAGALAKPAGCASDVTSEALNGTNGTC